MCTFSSFDTAQWLVNMLSPAASGHVFTYPLRQVYLLTDLAESRCILPPLGHYNQHQHLLNVYDILNNLYVFSRLSLFSGWVNDGDTILKIHRRRSIFQMDWTVTPICEDYEAEISPLSHTAVLTLTKPQKYVFDSIDWQEISWPVN